MVNLWLLRDADRSGARSSEHKMAAVALSLPAAPLFSSPLPYRRLYLLTGITGRGRSRSW